jgi:hypothetical protein
MNLLKRRLNNPFCIDFVIAPAASLMNQARWAGLARVVLGFTWLPGFNFPGSVFVGSAGDGRLRLAAFYTIFLLHSFDARGMTLIGIE